MEPIECSPKLHVLVCTNDRPASDPLPCCAASDGDEIYMRLHAHVLAQGWAEFVYVTRTGCMAHCDDAGATVVIQPLGVWLRRVQLDDVDQLVQELLEPLVLEMGRSRG